MPIVMSSSRAPRTGGQLAGGSVIAAQKAGMREAVNHERAAVEPKTSVAGSDACLDSP